MADEVKKDKKEKLGNCGGCGKVVKKIRRYYRNGKYYCTQVCYRNFLAKAKKKAESATEA